MFVYNECKFCGKKDGQVGILIIETICVLNKQDIRE